MSTKHTPGPWLLETKKNPRYSSETGDRFEDEVIHKIWSGDKCVYYVVGKGELDESNAHLVAAAPELLETLETATAALMAIIEMSVQIPMEATTKKALHETILNIVKASVPVIRKAKGETR